MVAAWACSKAAVAPEVAEPKDARVLASHFAKLLTASDGDCDGTAVMSPTMAMASTCSSLGSAVGSDGGASFDVASSEGDSSAWASLA